MKPERIQLRRTKGWRMPENTVRVARPGPFGNKFRIGGHYKRGGRLGGAGLIGALQMIYIEAADGYQDETYTTIKTNAEAVEWFRWYQAQRPPAELQGDLAHLHGKNVACFCKLSETCHGDVWLELANA